MPSKSNAFLILYILVAAFITLTFLAIEPGHFSTLLSSWGVAPPAQSLDLVNRLSMRSDLIAFCAVVATALVASAFGGNKTGILIGGTIAAFIVLTAHQALPMVRYMSLAAVLFAIGMYGMVVSRNAVRMLISIELMINAANINFVTFARYIDPADLKGQLFAVFVLTVAAAEAAVGLAIVLAVYRNMTTVDMEKFDLLKW